MALTHKTRVQIPAREHFLEWSPNSLQRGAQILIYSKIFFQINLGIISVYASLTRPAPSSARVLILSCPRTPGCSQCVSPRRQLITPKSGRANKQSQPSPNVSLEFDSSTGVRRKFDGSFDAVSGIASFEFICHRVTLFLCLPRASGQPAASERAASWSVERGPLVL